jgi:hypothetical protein
MMNGIVSAIIRTAALISNNFALLRSLMTIILLFLSILQIRNMEKYSPFCMNSFTIGVGTNSLCNAGEDYHSIVKPLEIFCNGVTAEVLVPADLFANKWNASIKDTKDKFDALSDYFKCSQLVITRRAFESGFISNEEYADAATETKERIVRKASGGGSYYTTQATRIDHRFLLALESSVIEGKTLYTDVFRLTDTNS